MNDQNKLQPVNKEVKAIVPAKDMDAVELTLMQGDLSRLSLPERRSYVKAICDSLGLNLLTRPFDYLSLDGKLVLYTKKEATEQLRKNNNVSLEILDRQFLNELYIVRAKATMPNGRTDEATGVVYVGSGANLMKGNALANAVMKAETKAKRRVTLSICGLGFLDESEFDTIQNMQILPMDAYDAETTESKQLPPAPAAAPAKVAKPPIKPPETIDATPTAPQAAPAPQPVPAQPAPAPAPVPERQLTQAPKQSPYVTLPEDLPPDAPRAGATANPAPPEAPEPLISQAQVRRLYTIASSAKWKDAGIKQFMFRSFNIDSALQLKPKQYDWLCSVVEQHTFEEAMDILEKSQAGKAAAAEVAQ